MLHTGSRTSIGVWPIGVRGPPLSLGCSRMAYLTLARFKLLSPIPSAFVDRVEIVQPGYTEAQLEYWSHWIDARLRKRYAAPFSAPYPNAVEGWLARIVTPLVWEKRGVDPTDQQWSRTAADADEAQKEVQEAADAEFGAFDLPLRGDTTQGGIVRGGSLSYSEASPYVSMDVQAQRGRGEDDSGYGSGGGGL